MPVTDSESSDIHLYAHKATASPHIGILRKSRSKVAFQHICMSVFARPSVLHRYYSSSLSPYGACSTSHLGCLFNIVRQHSDFVSETCICGHETVSNDEILKISIFKKCKSLGLGQTQLRTQSMERHETWIESKVK